MGGVTAVRTDGKWREFRSGPLRYSLAEPRDESELRAVLRANEMADWVSMSLEREPDYFAGEHLMGTTSTVIVRDQSRREAIVGMYAHSAYGVYWNGLPTVCEYLAALRVNRAYRNRAQVVRAGFDSIRELFESRWSAVRFTTIAAGNLTARRFLEAGLPGFPRYDFVGEFDTLAISVKRARDSSRLTSMAPADVPRLVEFFNRSASRQQLSPVLDVSWLAEPTPGAGLALKDFWVMEEEGRIRACLALWDQRTFKQTVARGYTFPLQLLRPAYNLWADISRRIRLPAVGQSLEQVYISFLAFETDESTTIDLLREALAKVAARGAHVATLGMSPTHPLYSRILREFAPIQYRVRVYAVSWPGEERVASDGRPVQPEVAML